MPGTIHVSVLGFEDLPSSLPPSSIFVKVSMGKREYQTLEKADFSFPLTTLRDNVTIKVWDTKGNEISHTAVQTKLVVEKGSWDEFLSLEGGGRVRTKLQFVLNEEERNRIRKMRESAMKKKELLNRNRSRSVGSSSGNSNEVSDKQQSANHKRTVSIGDLPIHTGTEAVSIGDQPIHTSTEAMNIGDRPIHTGTEVVSVGDQPIHTGTSTNPGCAAGSEEGTAFHHQRQVSPNDADGTEETSSATSTSERVDKRLGDLSHSKSVEKIETNLRRVDVPKRPVFLQEDSSTTKKNLFASELKNDRADQLRKQDPLGKTPSNDVKTGIKSPPAAKMPSSRVGGEVPKDQSVKEINKPAKQTSGRLKNPFLTGYLQQIQTFEVNREGRVGFAEDLFGSKSSHDTGKLKEPSSVQIQAKETESAAKDELRKPQEDLVRMSGVEEATVLRNLFGNKTSQDIGMLKEPSTIPIQVKETESAAKDELKRPQQDLMRMSVVEEATVPRNFREENSGLHQHNDLLVNESRLSEDDLKSEAFRENENSSYESSGAWTFPAQGRCSCITTGSKQEMDLGGSSRIQERIDTGRKSFSMPENEEKFENHTELKKADETSQKLRESSLQSSAEVETSNGPFGQVIKVVIMVAFGTLVLLTRQRKPR
ncbi:Titin like isoform 1 [Actinidia chinensis var. chinensis]|uniref:Titin like isoform 1 n=1 Tax=Actinidia chinensis var. chinensis TaxID=1590841 RepID=A0A2R6R495_ACTCC|nr:Titin like isoform 1 [Actinidia chinensis var. chinensis]